MNSKQLSDGLVDTAPITADGRKSQNAKDDLLDLGVRHAGRTEKKKRRQVEILDIKIAPPSFCTFANTE
jgi:hypothetical protein